MTLSTLVCLDAITTHSAGLAAAARDQLREQVSHCPGWDVAELVQHVTEVHWSWSTIADELLDAPPDGSRRPARVDDDRLVDVFEAGAQHLVDVLGAADQDAHCWTWAPLAQNVAFITRHQVQEAAVHHWDAADATGAIWTIDPQVAADCVDEFLEFSLSTEVDPADPLPPPLGGAFALVAADVGVSWSVRDGSTPGTLAVDGAAAATVDEAVPVIEATAADLLLWLYERTEIDTSPVPAVLIERFRALTFTD